MEPNLSSTGTTGAGQTAEGQSLSPQTNVNQGSQRAGINTGGNQGTIPGTNRITNQEGASFSGPGGAGNDQQPNQGRSNSS